MRSRRPAWGKCLRLSRVVLPPFLQLIYGQDYQGAQCGINDPNDQIAYPNHKWKKKIVYPRINDDLEEWVIAQPPSPLSSITIQSCSSPAWPGPGVTEAAQFVYVYTSAVLTEIACQKV